MVVPLPGVAVSAFLFGKLPAHGDFVCRGLAAEERDALDDWMAEELAIARAGLGDGFEAAFDAAPPWRFAWREAEAWSAGALAASADAVGRRFPLLLGRRAVAPGDATGVAAQCEEAIYDAVLGAWSADRLLEKAESFDSAGGGGAAPSEHWWVDGGDEAEVPPLSGRRPRGLLCAVLQSGNRA